MHLERFDFLDHNNIQVPALALLDHTGIVHSATEWMRYLTIHSDYAFGTISRYAEALKYFCEYLEGLDSSGFYGTTDSKLLMANRRHVDEWLAYERDIKGTSKNSRSTREAGVKNFFIWLSSNVSNYQKEDHPYSRKPALTSRGSTKRTRTDVLEEAGMERLLMSFHNECERCMWHFAFDSGARIKELINLKKRHIDLANEVYRLARSKFAYQEGTEVRYIPLNIPTLKKRGDRNSEGEDLPVFISAPTLERIIEYHRMPSYEYAPEWNPDDPEKPAFLTTNSRAWAYANARSQLLKAKERAGLRIKITPHVFRHSSAVSILTSADHGKDHLDRFFSAWANLRHAGMETTERYAHLPWSSLFKVCEDDSVYDRSKRLKDSTQLASINHREKRGHSQ